MSELDLIDIGSVIRRVRKARGLRLGDLADENISTATVSNIERGVRHVSAEKVMYLLEKMGISMSDLPELLEDEQNESAELKLQLSAIDSMLGYTDTDKLIGLLNSFHLTDDDKFAAYSHYLKGKCFALQSNWDEAKKAYLNAIRLSSTSVYAQKKNIPARCFVEIGLCYYYQNDLIQALQYTKQSADVFVENSEYIQLKYIIYCNITRYLEKLGRLEEALKMVDYLWSHIDEMDDNTIFHVYELRVQLLKRTKMYNEAIKYAEEGIELARINGDKIGLFYLWTALGSTYLCMKESKKSEICLQCALSIGCPQLNSLVEAYIQLLLVYMEQEEWHRVHELLETVESLAKEANIIPSFFAYLVIGDFHYRQNRYKQALTYYQKTFNLARNYGYKRLERKAFLRLIQLKKFTNKEELYNFLETIYELAASFEETDDVESYDLIDTWKV